MRDLASPAEDFIFMARSFDENGPARHRGNILGELSATTTKPERSVPGKWPLEDRNRD